MKLVNGSTAKKELRFASTDSGAPPADPVGDYPKPGSPAESRDSIVCSCSKVHEINHDDRELHNTDGVPVDGYSTGLRNNSHQYDFLCVGDESHLQRCPSLSCSSSEDAGVICFNG